MIWENLNEREYIPDSSRIWCLFMLSNSHLNILLSQQSLLLLLPPYYSYFVYYYPLQRGTISSIGGWVVGTFIKTLVWRTVAFLLSFLGWSVDKKLFLISKTKQRICSSETLERRGGRQTAQLNSEMTNSSFVRSLECCVLFWKCACYSAPPFVMMMRRGDDVVRSSLLTVLWGPGRGSS